MDREQAAQMAGDGIYRALRARIMGTRTPIEVDRAFAYAEGYLQASADFAWITPDRQGDLRAALRGLCDAQKQALVGAELMVRGVPA